MSQRRFNQQGFTLVELMIGMVIVSFIWIGVASLFSSQLAASVSNQDEVEQQSAVQSVSYMISGDIIMSGFGIDALQPFVHANNVTTGGDRITLSSAAQFGSTISSVIMSGTTGTGAGATDIWVRCFGDDIWGGGNADPIRDFVLDTNAPSQSLWITFFDPFSGKRLTYLPAWTQVTATLPIVGQPCLTAGTGQPPIDNNGDGISDPMVNLTLATGLTANVPNGSVVYGIRWPTALGTPSSTITYEVSGGNLVKTTAGGAMPIFNGVENFQVQYRVRGNPNWLNSLNGVVTADIEQVRYSMLVRSRRKNTLSRLDPRASIQVYDQTVALSADDREYSRELYEFVVRPKNNGILLKLTPL